MFAATFREMDILLKSNRAILKEVGNLISNPAYESLKNDSEIRKGITFPVGTVRTWRGKKYIKTASGKWERKYDARVVSSDNGLDDAAKKKAGIEEINPKLIKKNFNLLNRIFESGKTVLVESPHIGKVAIELGEKGKSGYGLMHIIEQRYTKDNMSIDHITALCALVIQTVREGEVTRANQRIIELQSENGIVTLVRKPDDKRYHWVLTGFDNWDKKKEATGAIKTVIAQNRYTPEYSSFRKQVGAVVGSLSDKHR